MSHPDTLVLERFAQGVSSKGERQEVILHLLRGCSVCGGGIRNFLRRKETDSAYDRAFETVAARARGQQGALARLRRLLDVPRERRTAVLTGDPELQSIAFVEIVLRELEESVNQDPRRMLDLSEIGVAALDLIQAGDEEGRNLRTKAWGHHANALRVHGRLRDAEIAFRRAEEHGGTAPLVRARLLRQKASLRSHQRKFSEAVALASGAAEIYRDLGLPEEMARCLVKQAIFLGYWGKPREAFDLASEALHLVIADGDLARQAVHVAARFSIDLGQPELGLSLLSELRDSLRDGKLAIAELRLTWLRGELAHALGRLDDAQRNLAEARRGLIEAGLSYEVALVSLELAMVHAKEGRTGDMARIIQESLAILQSIGIEQENLASLCLTQAVPGPSIALLQALARDLRREIDQHPHARRRDRCR